MCHLLAVLICGCLIVVPVINPSRKDRHPVFIAPGDSDWHLCKSILEPCAVTCCTQDILVNRFSCSICGSLYLA